MRAQPLRVLVWASYPALRAGLSELVRDEGFEVAAELSSVAGLEATDVAADVIVAQVDDAGSAQEVARLAELFALPSVVLVASTDAPRDALRDIEAGRGWISRESNGEELATAIRAVVAGLVVLDPGFAAMLREEPPDTNDHVGGEALLTARELDVLRWLALGLPNKAIALQLGISEHTVKFHVGSVLSKLDARSRTEAVMTAARRGLLTL